MNTENISKFSIISGGFDFFNIKVNDLITPAILGALATLFRVLALSMFLPIIHILFSGEQTFRGRIGQLLPEQISASPQLPLIFASMIFIAALISGACAYVNNLLQADLFERCSHTAKIQIFQKFLNYGQFYFDRTHINRNALRMRKLPGRAVRFVRFLADNIKYSLEFLIYFIAMLLLAWPLAVAVIIILMIYFALFSQAATYLEKTNAEIDDAEDNMGAEAQDILSNVTLVRHTCMLKSEQDRWANLASKLSNIRLQQQRWTGLVNPGIQTLSILIMLTFVFAASELITAIDPYDVIRYILFFVFLRRAITSFAKFLKIPGEWKIIQRDLQKCLSLVSQTDTTIATQGPASLQQHHQQIKIVNLYFGYNKHNYILKDINLTIPTNRLSVLIGASGSGKSTFLRLLMRDYEFDQGDIIINGKSIKHYTHESLLNSATYLGEITPLLCNTTIAQNIKYGLGDIDPLDFKHALKQSSCNEFLTNFEAGVDTDIGEQTRLLSSGERQRLGFARVLLKKNATLVLLDEATSSVSSDIERTFLDELISRPNTTIILVTHRLSVIREDTNIIVFDDGCAIEQGTRAELIARNGYFKHLWDYQLATII